MKDAEFSVGLHTGGFNSAYISFEQAVKWAADHGVRNIECGFIDGTAWNHGLGYFPHLASWQDPLMMKDVLQQHHVRLSQIDAAFPISGKLGPTVAVPYIEHTIRWASLAGCPMVDTTDGLAMPEGMHEKEAMSLMKLCYQHVAEIAERFGILINIETHGYFTARPDFLEEMLDFCDSTLLQLNFDTGNVYIAGHDPSVFLRKFINRVSHLHVKDVAPKRSHDMRGKEYGIGMSHCAVGEGVNAGEIAACLELLRDHGFQGDMSIECEAAGGPVMERSISWVRNTLDDLEISHDLEEQ